MMRGKSISSMQKTYDECYLTCSTAVFFESQNNEAEALRSWKSALDQINHYNAYKLPSNYTPRSETERALYDALMQMGAQCKERVDLLEALKQSRKEAGKIDPGTRSNDFGRSSLGIEQEGLTTWLGDNSVPPAQYSDLPSRSPALPPRPSITPRKSSSSVLERNNNSSGIQPASLGAPPTLPIPAQKQSRSPSPDHSRRPMRTTLRPERKGPRQARTSTTQPRKPATMKAAGLAWDSQQPRNSTNSPRIDSDPAIEARLSAVAARRSIDQPYVNEQRMDSVVSMPDPADFMTSSRDDQMALNAAFGSMDVNPRKTSTTTSNLPYPDAERPPVPPPHRNIPSAVHQSTSQTGAPVTPKAKLPEIKYRNEYPSTASTIPPSIAKPIIDKAYNKDKPASPISRKPVGSGDRSGARVTRPRKTTESESEQDLTAKSRKQREDKKDISGTITPPSSEEDTSEDSDSNKTDYDKKVEELLKNLPKGIDSFAAKNILNEIVVKGDEVHWDDVAGLDAAKKALKEAVVYPFLRPDLFSGLREPARGMLLFGPPGTGKTMLARAVATESKSTFFAISASSLTSKWHGESEKLVRALFAMAKALAPSIIFVDEIDSLLNSRGGGTEHEASRRSKTEFLIQWSDLQRAAAGKDTGLGDASRVLVLAATNCPWDIDDAARRRFVRRQYIPLPEAATRETQIRTLLRTQKHEMSKRDIAQLVAWTDGYSGSDMTSLCKDAAMQPLRNLGEALLTTPIDQIRPINLADFQASLESIRPSVSKKGLEEFEAWATEFGERA